MVIAILFNPIFRAVGRDDWDDKHVYGIQRQLVEVVTTVERVGSIGGASVTIDRRAQERARKGASEAGEPEGR